MPRKPTPTDELRMRYRSVFIESTGGRWVLGNILNGPCRFFQMCMDDETRIRQNVGREIMNVIGLFDESKSPQSIVNKLARKPNLELTFWQFFKMKLKRRKL